MPRSPVRVLLILALISLAIFLPLISSGYSELRMASTASSYSEVAEHYQRAAQRIPWRPDLYELAGHAYYYAKEYSVADAAYQKAFQRDALSAEGWVAWGDVNYLSDDSERASDIWEQGLEQARPSDHLYSRLAENYRSGGEYSRAADYLQKYVSLHPEDASARYRLGLLLTLSDPDRALSELIDASQLDPELDPAVQTLRTTLNLASTNDSPSARLVIIGRGLGLVEEWELARAAFEEAVEADGKNAEAWAWLGESHQHTGAPEGGGAELDRAFELNPGSSTVRGLRGLYFQRVGNFRQALTEFQSAARSEPDNPAWQVSIGESYAKLGDLISALDAYRAATTLAPEEANYWRLLAIFCGQTTVNITDVGIPAAQKAVILAEDDAASFDVLGWLLLLDARHEEAARMLAHALELDSRNASVHLHLGMLYMQTGDRLSAYNHLILARDLGSGEAEAILQQYFP